MSLSSRMAQTTPRKQPNHPERARNIRNEERGGKIREGRQQEREARPGAGKARDTSLGKRG
jgi:hypothetical protein